MALLILTWILLLGCVPEITKNILVLTRESINLPIVRDISTRRKLFGLLPQKNLCRLLTYVNQLFIFISSVNSGLITGAVKYHKINV